MALPARHGRPDKRGPWVRALSVLVVLALVPLGSLPAAARPGMPATGVQRAQVEVGEDDEEGARLPEDDRGDEDEVGRAAYESPRFGFVLAYDPDAWEIQAEDSGDAGDWVRFYNGPSFVSLSATDVFDGDPAACLESWADSLEANDRLDDVALLADEEGWPVIDEDEQSVHVAFAVRSADGIEVFDATCQVLIEDEVTLAIVLETFADLYENQLDAKNDLLDGLDLTDIESSGRVRQDDDDDEDAAAGEPEIVADDFADEAAGVFTTDSSEPDRVRYAYDAGEFVIETLEPDAGVWQVQLNGPYADVAVAVDARLDGGTEGRFVKIGCRFTRTGDGFEEYSFVVDPDARRALLYRSDGEDVVILADEEGFDAVNPDDEANRLELRCVGATIAAAINGEAFAEVEDDRYTTGAVYLGAGTYAGVRGTVEARFDDLEVTIYGGGNGGDEDDDRDIVREGFEGDAAG